jgi:hypothetical protein
MIRDAQADASRREGSSVVADVLAQLTGPAGRLHSSKIKKAPV